MEALGQESNQPWAAHWATLWAAYLGLRVSTFLLDYEDVCAAINKEHTGISPDELVMRGPRAARMQDWAFFVRRNVKRGKYVDCSTAFTMILARIPRIPVTPVQRAFLARMEHLSSVDAAYAPALDDALRSVDNSMLPGLVAGNNEDAREEIDLLPGIAESLGQARWPRYEMAIPNGETLQQRVAQRTDIGVSEARASKLSRTTCLVLLALPIVPFPLIGQLVGTPAPVHVMHELLVARPARLRSSVVVFLDAFCWFPAGLMFHDDKDREYLYGGVSLFTVGRRTDEWLWPATTVRLALAHFLDARICHLSSDDTPHCRRGWSRQRTALPKRRAGSSTSTYVSCSNACRRQTYSACACRCCWMPVWMQRFTTPPWGGRCSCFP